MQFLCADVIDCWTEVSLMQKRHHTALCWDRNQSEFYIEWITDSRTDCFNVRHRSIYKEKWYLLQCFLKHFLCWNPVTCDSEAWFMNQWQNITLSDSNNQTGITVLWGIMCTVSGYEPPQQAEIDETLPCVVCMREWQIRSTAVLRQEESTWG